MHTNRIRWKIYYKEMKNSKKLGKTKNDIRKDSDEEHKKNKDNVYRDFDYSRNIWVDVN